MSRGGEGHVFVDGTFNIVDCLFMYLRRSDSLMAEITHRPSVGLYNIIAVTNSII